MIYRTGKSTQLARSAHFGKIPRRRNTIQATKQSRNTISTCHFFFFLKETTRILYKLWSNTVHSPNESKLKLSKASCKNKLACEVPSRLTPKIAPRDKININESAP